MGLEDSRYLLVPVKFADRLHALRDFGGMMGVVAEEYESVRLYLEVETAVYAAETGHSLSDFLIGYPVQVCKRHGCHAVLYVDADRYTEPDIVDAGVRSNEVDDDFTVSDADVLGMEVSFVAGVGISSYARLYIRLQGKPLPDNQCPSRLDKGGVVAEAFKISLARAVYVQMVGVGRGDNAHIGRKPVERTVKLVGFDYGVRTGRR